jgi:hypothetical protein
MSGELQLEMVIGPGTKVNFGLTVSTMDTSWVVVAVFAAASLAVQVMVVFPDEKWAGALPVTVGAAAPHTSSAFGGVTMIAQVLDITGDGGTLKNGGVVSTKVMFRLAVGGQAMKVSMSPGVPAAGVAEAQPA